MIPTRPVLSKALRRALTPKHGNKDFYKGTRQAFLPGGHRTGAPGKHVVRGSGKYRLVDEQVRVFVAPAIVDIENSKLKAYVSSKISAEGVKGYPEEVYGASLGRGLLPRTYYEIAPRE
ncbi:uncharacterized protein BXZ73DRAFT_89679 [Epithele typhae]|uniref:uncharacterized protein n=1 Tax=Epithele typhae TaxID=378194 RepID=UPI002007F74C|nr:uncharacterized protein BXZ73DRAFT_89679 [Epithele typhae]KAH9934028.1 hypothetical protein BXZ73DRAFT_89679 [Epithele typhae]